MSGRHSAAAAKPSYSDVNIEGVAYQEIEGFGGVFQQGEEVCHDTFVNDVKVFNVEQVIRKYKYPGIVTYESSLALIGYMRRQVGNGEPREK
jgi:hypothetical protein